MIDIRLPQFTDYLIAVQHPQIAFRLDADLRVARVETDGLGTPRSWTGNFAYIFRFESSRGKWAVRCFSRYIPDASRYAGIRNFLTSHPLDFFVIPDYMPQGILVGGNWYPIIKMPWVQGTTLANYVDANIGNSARIRNLTGQFKSLASRLEAHGVAHGDLQHGNILVHPPDDKLMLVDYDSMYVPGLAKIQVEERGHENYQHPSRRDEFGADLDRFSSIVIYLALEALVRAPGLWEDYGAGGENLLFRQRDFLYPDESPLLRDLERLAGFESWIRQFRRICKADISQVPAFSDFLAGKVPTILQVRAEAVGRWRQYETVAAVNRDLLLSMVGQRVTVVGRITEHTSKTTIHNKPYVFLTFGDWRRSCFRLVIWSDGLENFRARGINPMGYQDRWISVTGLITEWRGSGRHHPQMVIENPLEIEELSGGEVEATKRLSGQTGSQPSSAKHQLQSRVNASLQPSADVRAQQSFDRARRYFEQENWDSAIQEFETAIQLNDRLYKARLLLGYAYGNKGRYDKAIQAFRQLLEVNPGYSEAHEGLGWAYHGQGRYDEAIEEYTLYLTVNPGSHNGHRELGEAYAMKGLLDEAISELQKAASIQPLDQETNQLLARLQEIRKNSQRDFHLSQAQLYKNQEQYEQAIRELQMLIRIAPNTVAAYEELAEICAQISRNAEAWQYAEEARKRGSQRIAQITGSWQPQILVSPTIVDFGEVQKGEAASRQLVIENRGRKPLLAKVNAAWWLAVSANQLECLPGDKQRISIYVPNSLEFGQYVSKNAIQIQSNDHSVEVEVRLQVNAPVLKTNTEHLVVVLKEDGLGEANFTVTNSGTGILQVNIKTAKTKPIEVEISPSSFRCPSNASQAVKASLQFRTTSTSQQRSVQSVQPPKVKVFVKSNGGEIEITLDPRFSRPSLKVLTPSIDFGTFAQGIPPAAKLRFSNDGGTILHGSIDAKSIPNWLSVDTVEFSLEPDQVSDIILAIIPKNVALRFPVLSRALSCNIEVQSNGGNAIIPVKLISKHRE